MIKHKVYILLVFVVGLAMDLRADKMKEGYKALKIYNYFKAKEIFEKGMRKKTLAAAYGLSIIYSRGDNPFTDIDSANKFITTCKNAFEAANKEKREAVLYFGISEKSIDSLLHEITQKAFISYKSKNSIAEWNRFIDAYTVPPYCYKAIDSRDSLVYMLARQKNTVQSYDEFLKGYPYSKYVTEAKQKFDLVLFLSSTIKNTIKEYENFIRENPTSPFKDDAENAIFKLSTRHGSISEYDQFIKKYPQNPNVETAWRTIYYLYTINYRTSVIENFIKEFPNYPFKETVNTDIFLSRKKMIPIRKNDRWGFIDTTGIVEIPCMYEWVNHFSEGLAECGLNEKAGFIDKTGKVIIP